MRRRYHLPADIAGTDGLPAQARQRLFTVVLGAIGAAVREEAPTETTPPSAEARPAPRERVSGDSRRAYAVPSYDKNGDRVGIPVPSRPGATPAAETVHWRLFREAAAFLRIKNGRELEQLLRVAVWFSETTTPKAFEEALLRDGLEGFWLWVSMRLVGVPRPAPSARLGADTILMLFGPEATPRDPRDPANPANTLSAREMFKLWQGYWYRRIDRAAERLAAITDSLKRRDLGAYLHNLKFFQNGVRDAFGPEYRAAADELDACRTVLMAEEKVLNWLVGRQAAHVSVTWDEVNERAVDEARGLAWLQRWIEPVLLGFLMAGFRPGGGGSTPAVLDEIPPEPARAPAPSPEPVAPRAVAAGPETVEEFLARGGKVTKVPPASPAQEPVTAIPRQPRDHRPFLGEGPESEAVDEATPRRAGGKAGRRPPERGQRRPPLPSGPAAPRAGIEPFEMPFEDPAAVAQQEEILDLAKTDPIRAGRQYEDLVARDFPGGTEVQNKFGRPGRRMDIGTEHEATIEGRADGFSQGKLDQLWDDLADKRSVLLTVPRLSEVARDQLARLLAQARTTFGPDVYISVRVTGP